MPLVLLIEDGADIRSSVAELLMAEGYSVAQAPGRASALAFLRTAKPDAIILDYALPCATEGAAFLTEKAKIAEAASIPVIVTSGFALPSQLEGAAAILAKPFDIDCLLGLVRRFVPAPDATSAA